MTDIATWPTASSAMTPVPYRVRSRVVENIATATIHLEPVRERLATPLPGQFTMLYAFGVGEIAMSFSDIPASDDGTFGHTIRSVGLVSRALANAHAGTIVGVRGPFGTGWDLDSCAGRDLVLVAGGCGLAPLRPAILQVLAERSRFGRVVVIAGCRAPQYFPFLAEAVEWAQHPDLDVELTVDSPDSDWPWRVGLVTEPLRELALDPRCTTALICGPEVQIWFSARALVDKGVAAGDIRVSLERNMQCGIGWCGHCQLGPLLLCRDGPVVGYDVAEPLLRVKEL